MQWSGEGAASGERGVTGTERCATCWRSGDDDAKTQEGERRRTTDDGGSTACSVSCRVSWRTPRAPNTRTVSCTPTTQENPRPSARDRSDATVTCVCYVVAPRTSTSPSAPRRVLCCAAAPLPGSVGLGRGAIACAKATRLRTGLGDPPPALLWIGSRVSSRPLRTSAHGAPGRGAPPRR